jgi:hypothetical protein
MGLPATKDLNTLLRGFSLRDLGFGAIARPKEVMSW